MNGRSEALRMMLESGITEKLKNSELAIEIAELFAPYIEMAVKNKHECELWKKEFQEIKDNLKQIISGKKVLEWDDE